MEQFTWLWRNTEVGPTKSCTAYGRLTTSGWSMEYSLLLLKYMRSNHGLWHPPDADCSQQVLTNYRFRCVMRKAMMTLASALCDLVTLRTMQVDYRRPLPWGPWYVLFMPPVRGAALLLSYFLFAIQQLFLMFFSWQWWPDKAHLRGIWAAVVSALSW